MTTVWLRWVMLVVAAWASSVAVAVEPPGAGVELVAGGRSCPAALVYRNLLLTSARCLDELAPQGGTLDHVRVTAGAVRGAARREIERGRPYVADYALVVVRWEQAPPAPVQLALTEAVRDEGTRWVGAVVVDAADRVVAVADPERGALPTARLVEESPRLSRFVVPEGERSQPPFLFPDDGDWF